MLPVPGSPRIWSLLPSATEILFALGLGDQVTGVTHECDYPPEASRKPRATVSYIDSSLSSREIDEQVTRHFREGLQLYGIDEALLRADPPDIIVTQDLCPVCAVSPSDFAGHIEPAGCSVITLNPNTLEDILHTIAQVGDGTNRTAEAAAYVEALRERIAGVESAVAGEPRRRVLTLEWLEPLMPGGHWVTEQVQIAGGCSGLIEPGKPSRKLPWAEVRAEDPDVIVLMPCGFEPERGAAEAEVLWHLEGWAEMRAVQSGEVYCLNGNALFSRPGPRVVDGIEVLAHVLHPKAWPQPPEPGSVLKLTSQRGSHGQFAAL